MSATRHRPKTNGRTAISRDHDEIIGVIDEAVGTAADQWCIGQDDDPRRPAGAERRKHPDARELNQHEQRRARSRRSADPGRATTRLASQAAWTATISG